MRFRRSKVNLFPGTLEALYLRTTNVSISRLVAHIFPKHHRPQLMDSILTFHCTYIRVLSIPLLLLLTQEYNNRMNVRPAWQQQLQVAPVNVAPVGVTASAGRGPTAGAVRPLPAAISRAFHRSMARRGRRKDVRDHIDCPPNGQSWGDAGRH